MTSTFLNTVKRAEPMAVKCFRNVVLHRADSAAAAGLSVSPQLVVLFPWVGAKERYAHKFVDSWTRRGFDVLHVTTPVWDLVRPNTGTEVTSLRVADYICDNDKYNVILHGISVGGYLGMRVLMALEGSHTMNRISHQIYDSFTQVAGFKAGVENGVSPRFRSIAKAGVGLYSRLADLSCLQRANDFAITSPSPTPVLYIHSMADKVSNYDCIRRMLPVAGRKNPAYKFIVPAEEGVGHVSLFRHIGELSYMSLITRFLRTNNFNVLNPEILMEQDPESEEGKLYNERIVRVSPTLA